MFYRRPLLCLVTGLLFVALSPASAPAGDFLELLKRPYTGPAPVYARQPGRAVAVPPGHERYYAYNVPDYPWYSNGLGVPTYNWGYFGARYRPGVSGEHPYFENYKGLSYRTGD
jgi:hypothetical protein